MELQIIEDKTNPQLKRREVSLKIQNRGTPSRIDVKNKLAALANSRPELIVIEKLTTEFGKQETLGTASIYEKEERLKQLAHKHLITRDAPKPVEEKPGEAAPARKEEPKSEPKAEEKKEDEKK
ncbi:MAG: 30S ribosomal protein S24e [Candidatus Methanoperedens sp.]|nr:30S ribosomal protein S24e [Candidatus Methanoperedens sp.]MCZ7360296.1 30S ribosomal protein S24e [Candidatus Methanoperedens sp.]HLB69914.1 30S ribosomal protein S24e [Candidatus Methanoperedens sp.]